MSTTAEASRPAEEAGRVRGLSTPSALGVNIIDMVGVGPFITLPLIVSAMGGPQAILGWVCGAALSMLDGLTWSELGSAQPEAGGSYAYLRDGLGNRTVGKGVSFIYAWQLLASAPLSIASGCIGFSAYASFFWSGSGTVFASFHVIGVPFELSGQVFLALAACLLALAIVSRSIGFMNRIVRPRGVLVIVTLLALVVVGVTHFDGGRAFSFPAGAWHLDHAFWAGLGAGLLVAVYDYWGYYNVCFLGAEVKRPSRTIPRAVLGAIAVVACLYLLLDVSVLGVLPWQGLIKTAESETATQYTMATFVEHAFSSHSWAHTAASVTVVLIGIISIASVIALLLGYSRIPYAAARDGNFPAAFGRLSSRRIPIVSLLTLGAITLFCCLFRLEDVIASLVVIRLLLQFLLQSGVALLPEHRRRRREPGSFRMPLYPLPILIAIGGFLYVLFSREEIWREFRLALIVGGSGAIVFGLRALREARRGRAPEEMAPDTRD